MYELRVGKINGLYDDVKEEFYTINPCVIQLEHSLISLRKWEQKWHKPFLGKKDDKTYEEIIDYIRCMSINKVKQPEVYEHLTKEQINNVVRYIKNPMTAAWFNEEMLQRSGIGIRGEEITSETIYYWMITLGIPIEMEKWHLNQLITLIRFINVKNSKNNGRMKMSKNEEARERARINAQRRAKLNSKG